MAEFDRVVVVIPSLNPDEKLCGTVEGLIAAGFSDIVVIDDGSREDTKKNFPAEGGHVTVLRHEVNRGKGAGLKTAFRYILDSRPDALGCVSADADGQHRPQDIAACAREMLAHPEDIVLGARDFSLPNVPERSRRGNRITSRVFKVLFSMTLSDTQTGLRAFPRAVLESMLSVRGDRYEYETNMLIEMKRRKIEYREVPIETVYINENAASHFRPVRDSIRIYGMIVAFLLSSVSSMLVDVTLFTVFNILLGALGVPFAYAIAVGGARVISSVFNYTLNRRVVFATGDRSSVVRYYILAVCQLALSVAVGQSLVWLVPRSEKWIETLIKLAVDTVLFFFSFRIQNSWVFRSGGESADGKHR